MKRTDCLLLIVLSVLVLVACANATPDHVEDVIQSGNEVDGMVFSPLDDSLNWNYSLYNNWNWQGGGEYWRHLDGCLFGYLRPSYTYPWESFGDYHNGRANVVFVDGHLEKLHPTNTIPACAGDWGDY